MWFGLNVVSLKIDININVMLKVEEECVNEDVIIKLKKIYKRI